VKTVWEGLKASPMLVRGGSPLASCDGMGYEMEVLRFELQKKNTKRKLRFVLLT
jgi:hypothetical protein